MMDSQSMDNITKLFDNSKLPNIDVKDKVMDRIYAKAQIKKVNKRKKLLYAAALSMALCFVVGFAAKQVLELKGTGGNKFIYSIFQRGDKEVSNALSNEMKKLKPGETVALMKTKDNPKNMINLYSKPIIVSNIDELKKSIGDNMKLPSYIPEGFSVSNCNFEKEFGGFSREAMIEEAKNSKETIIKKVFQPTDKIKAYEVMYEKGKDFIVCKINAYDLNFNSYGTEDRGQSAKKVKVNDFEAVFSENGNNYELTWLKNSGNTTETYSVRYGSAEKKSSDNIEKMLIKIAESIH